MISAFTPTELKMIAEEFKHHKSISEAINAIQREWGYGKLFQHFKQIRVVWMKCHPKDLKEEAMIFHLGWLLEGLKNGKTNGEMLENWSFNWDNEKSEFSTLHHFYSLKLAELKAQGAGGELITFMEGLTLRVKNDVALLKSPVARREEDWLEVGPVGRGIPESASRVSEPADQPPNQLDAQLLNQLDAQLLNQPNAQLLNQPNAQPPNQQPDVQPPNQQPDVQPPNQPGAQPPIPPDVEMQDHSHPPNNIDAIMLQKDEELRRVAANNALLQQEVLDMREVQRVITAEREKENQAAQDKAAAEKGLLREIEEARQALAAKNAALEAEQQRANQAAAELQRAAAENARLEREKQEAAAQFQQELQKKESANAEMQNLLAQAQRREDEEMKSVVPEAPLEQHERSCDVTMVEQVPLVQAPERMVERKGCLKQGQSEEQRLREIEQAKLEQRQQMEEESEDDDDEDESEQSSSKQASNAATLTDPVASSDQVTASDASLASSSDSRRSVRKQLIDPKRRQDYGEINSTGILLDNICRSSKRGIEIDGEKFPKDAMCTLAEALFADGKFGSKKRDAKRKGKSSSSDDGSDNEDGKMVLLEKNMKKCCVSTIGASATSAIYELYTALEDLGALDKNKCIFEFGSVGLLSLIALVRKGCTATLKQSGQTKEGATRLFNAACNMSGINPPGFEAVEDVPLGGLTVMKDGVLPHDPHLIVVHEPIVMHWENIINSKWSHLCTKDDLKAFLPAGLNAYDNVVGYHVYHRGTVCPSYQLNGAQQRALKDVTGLQSILHALTTSHLVGNEAKMVYEALYHKLEMEMEAPSQFFRNLASVCSPPLMFAPTGTNRVICKRDPTSCWVAFGLFTKCIPPPQGTANIKVDKRGFTTKGAAKAYLFKPAKVGDLKDYLSNK